MQVNHGSKANDSAHPQTCNTKSGGKAGNKANDSAHPQTCNTKSGGKPGKVGNKANDSVLIYNYIHSKNGFCSLDKGLCHVNPQRRKQVLSVSILPISQKEVVVRAKPWNNSDLI